VIEVISVVLHPGKNKADVFARGHDGVIREIALSWLTRVPRDRLPDNWLEVVEGEVVQQIANDAAEKAGRTLF
jgi:hypothetical protein